MIQRTKNDDPFKIGFHHSSVKILLFTLIVIVVFPIVILSNVWAETSSKKTLREATERADLITKTIEEDLKKESELSEQGFAGESTLLVYSDTSWSGTIKDTSDKFRKIEGEGNKKISFTCIYDQNFFINIQTQGDGYLGMVVLYRGQITNEEFTDVKNIPIDLASTCGLTGSSTSTQSKDILSDISVSIIRPAIPQFTNEEWIKQDIKDQLVEPSNSIPNHAVLLIYTDSGWSGAIQDSGLDSKSVSGEGPTRIPFECSAGGIYSLNIQHQEGFLLTGSDLDFEGKILKLMLAVIQDGKLLDVESTYTKYGVVGLAGKCQPSTVALAVEKTNTNTKSGGCLIATAAFGSELAPQVQLLRETRDNIVLQTKSGAAFMTGFNSVYYTFAPTVADWERQNPVFQEIVKITITPLITTLSILNYVNIDSEIEMLGYGVGIILLNIGMYFVAPAFVIVKLKHRLLS